MRFKEIAQKICQHVYNRCCRRKSLSANNQQPTTSNQQLLAVTDAGLIYKELNKS